MNDDDVVAALSAPQAVALTLYGEARSQRVEGRIAVANVIRNRVRLERAAFGLGYKGVCLKAWQFSCWLPQGGRSNYELVMRTARSVVEATHTGAMMRECLWIADGVMQDRVMDNVRGATHYYSPAAMVPKDSEPAWAKGLSPAAILGGHLFYADVK